ncbi:hypothetical protein ACHHYP_02704 [Achlya hypogyna]|uniref:Uncharacterized protein n=1 Tax=Achlya hypogyna TaxID=1202772 RepID=A0A1V9ZSL4_ACHHY|nr:hypothetical protein ACHHYP_02704 [Achlya hypogyna]
MKGQELPATRAQAKRWYISEDSAGFHWWPLPIALFAISTLLYAGSFSYEQGWLDKFTGNLTRIQFHDPDVLQGGCMAINHKMTWRELRNKASKCARGSYFDPLHNDCYQCSAPMPQDRIFALYWNAETECRDLLLQPDLRFASHVLWTGAKLDTTTGEIVKPTLPADAMHVSRCMMEMRSRCIKQIAVIGGPGVSFATALNSDAKVDAFVASVVQHVTKFKLDGVHIADVGGNDATNGGDWKSNYSPLAVKYMKALRKAFDALTVPNVPALTLSWEEVASAFDATTTSAAGYKGCKQMSDDTGVYRCFNADIAASADFISFQVFGRHQSVELKSLMASKPWAEAVPATKLVINTCSAPSPFCRGAPLAQNDLVSVAKACSDLYKGVGLASGTEDVVKNHGASVTAMGPMGAYGVLLPQRAPKQPSTGTP